MQNALEPYYGGDHHAHAKRIFDAHIAGGFDHIGFFSFEQKMFVAEVNKERAAMIHMVGKRQATYKISPLIVDLKFQGKAGLGSRLLEYAEDYARNHEARQLYCTVAEQNIGALQFFIKKGFIRAGSSDSHYKSGVTETMLYKPLFDIRTIVSLDQLHVSVLPLDETDIGTKEKVRCLLIDKLQSSFEGIKVMPFIATNISAFEALLMDIPYQLVSYGHKLYIHINPTVEEVISLQRLGWKLDAALPAAYHLGVVTQQWSLKIGETTMRTMRIKQRFFDLIQSNKKTHEVRVGYDSINRIRIGERIMLESHVNQMEVKVADIRRYRSFEDMLGMEPWERIVPDSRSREEVLSLLKRIYPGDKERLGVVVIEFAKTA